jgi:hypothetical protein
MSLPNHHLPVFGEQEVNRTRWLCRAHEQESSPCGADHSASGSVLPARQPPAPKDSMLPPWMAFLRGHSTSGAGVSRGSFSSLSLELVSLSESEELSESLVLSDSVLLECADATGSGRDCGALQSKDKIRRPRKVGLFPLSPCAFSCF